MTGRRFAYLGVIVGLAVSVAANVAHAASQPGGASVWALGMAGFWPCALFLALEVLTRNTWTGGRGLLVARLGVALVALVAACLSYLHLRGLLLTYGEGPFSATVGPFGVDGLMAVSAAALLTVHAPEAVAGEALEPVSEPEPLPANDPTPELVRTPAILRRPVRVAAAATPRRQRVTVPTGTRTDDELRGELASAIAAGRLPATPSAEAIRTELKIAPGRARALRDAVRTP